MIEILKYIWQIPQHLVALIYYLWLVIMQSKLLEYKYGDYIVVTKSSNGCVALGKYLFINENTALPVLKHESGHAMQSEILGPLYLIVIGLPSLLWAMTHKWILPGKDYYWFYTESWANGLTEIDIHS